MRTLGYWLGAIYMGLSMLGWAIVAALFGMS